MSVSVASYLRALPRRSRGLLTDVRPMEGAPEGAVLLLARYELARFDEAIAREFSLDLPARLHKAVTKRRAEFLAGRIMAKAAQVALHLTPAQVGFGEDRAPAWPPGVTGSISHARGLCACLMSRKLTWGLGIDVEAIAEGSALRAIRTQVLDPAEAEWLATQGAADPAIEATLLFSAKEALFKALYPRVGRHFGFDCATLAGPVDADRLTLELTRDLGPRARAGERHQVRFAVLGDHVMTWVAAPE